MAYRILTAAALAVALAAPALADDEEDVLRVIVQRAAPECSQPVSKLTVQQLSLCKEMVGDLRSFYRRMDDARTSAVAEQNRVTVAPVAPSQPLKSETIIFNPIAGPAQVDQKCRKVNACLKIYGPEPVFFP
ncbi:MAG TPA: hypothetical protein VGD41_14225 [Pyrinomonadaceae bacterium]